MKFAQFECLPITNSFIDSGPSIIKPANLCFSIMIGKLFKAFQETDCMTIVKIHNKNACESHNNKMFFFATSARTTLDLVDVQLVWFAQTMLLVCCSTQCSQSVYIGALLCKCG